MKMNRIRGSAVLSLCLFAGAVSAAEYTIDSRGMHAAVQFKISHLGFSWLWGRFNEFEGRFNYDENNPNASSIEVTVNTKSVDSNHAERDKHLRSSDFLDVERYPQASFKSRAFSQNSQGAGQLTGDLTLHGVTQPIVVQTKLVGQGNDPWGGYRIGFEGKTTITLADFGITKDLGAASRVLDLMLSFEGVRR